jgi:hypothetical protein
MSSPSRVVSLSAIQHPRVPSNTTLAEICGRCHELLPMTVVTPTCMPLFHTSQELGMIQCNKQGDDFPFTPNLFMPFVGETFKYTWSPTSNCKGQRLLFAQLSWRNFAAFKFTWIRCTVASVSSTMSGPNIAFSSDSIQLSGVRHCRPYNASIGAIFKLSW